MKRVLSVTALALVLASCASHTGVVPLGQETFMIAKQQATGFPGLGNMKAEIITEGAAYCSAKGQEFKLVSANETQPPYVLGNYPRSEIHFKCLSQKGPTTAQAKYSSLMPALVSQSD